MRISSTLGRLTALTMLILGSAVSVASAGQDAGVTLTTVSGAKVEATRLGYVLSSSYSLACPSSAGSAGCEVTTNVTALVQPVGAPRRVATVATAKTTVAAGTSRRIAARLNSVGAAELRRAGRFRARLAITGTITRGNQSPTGNSFSREQLLGIPPMVVTEETRATRVTLAPGQRLVLRLKGENASTGYAWKFDPLAASAALRRISSRSIVDPSCSAGMVGCFSTREVVYVGRSGGLTSISTGLYGPQAMTDATVRISLRVTTKPLLPLPKVLRASANGTTVTRRMSQPVVVVLAGASGSTGYAWRPITGSITPFASVTVPDDCQVGFVGCSNTSEFSFISSAASATVSLGLFAPGATTPERTFTVRLMAPVA